jgi:hypothetical protein
VLNGCRDALRQRARGDRRDRAAAVAWQAHPSAEPSGSTQLGLLSLQDSVTKTSLAFGFFRDGKFSAVPTPAALVSEGDLPLSYIAW